MIMFWVVYFEWEISKYFILAFDCRHLYIILIASTSQTYFFQIGFNSQHHWIEKVIVCFGHSSFEVLSTNHDIHVHQINPLESNWIFIKSNIKYNVEINLCFSYCVFPFIWIRFWILVCVCLCAWDQQKDDTLCLLATNPSKSSPRNGGQQNKKEKRQLIIATTLCFFFMVSGQQVLLSKF